MVLLLPDPHTRRLRSARRIRLAPALLAAVVLLLPFVLEGRWLSASVFTLIAVVGAVSLNILTGMTGQISLGHAFFFGLGTFTAATLGGGTRTGFSTAELVGFNLPWFIWLPMAAILAALVGVLIAPAAVRLKGFYLAVITLGLTAIGEHIFENATALTGGVPGRSVGGVALFGHSLDDPLSIAGLTLSRNQQWYFFILAFAALSCWFAANLTHSRTGRAFLAVRDRDVAASIMGVDVTRTKLVAFALSSGMAGVAGGLFGAYLGQVAGPETFTLAFSIEYIAMIIIGGWGSVLGSVLGAVFVTMMPTVIVQFSSVFPFLRRGTEPGLIGPDRFSVMLYGITLIIFLMFQPRGLAGLWKRARSALAAWPYNPR